MGDIKFIEGASPLNKRIWVDIDNSTNIEEVLKNVEQNISLKTTYQLQFNLNVLGNQKELHTVIEEIITRIQKITVSYSSRFPEIAVFVASNLINEELINLINAHDKYRPGITLNVMIPDSVIESLVPINLTQKRKIAGEIIEHCKLCDKVALNYNIFLYVKENTDFLSDLIDLGKIVYTYDTSLDVPRPYLNINPKAKIDNLPHFDKEVSEFLDMDDSQSFLQGPCGFLNFYFRQKVNKSLDGNIIPLFSCGISQSEQCYTNNTSKLCMHCDSEVILDEYKDVCKKCEHVCLCTGCHSILEGDSQHCNFKNILDMHKKNS